MVSTRASTNSARDRPSRPDGAPRTWTRPFAKRARTVRPPRSTTSAAARARAAATGGAPPSAAAATRRATASAPTAGARARRETGVTAPARRSTRTIPLRPGEPHAIGAGEHRLDVLEPRRLREVRVEPRLVRALQVLGQGVPGERDEERAALAVRAQPASHLVPVDPGQADVAEHGVRPPLCRDAHPLVAVVRHLDLVTAEPEHVGEGLGGVDVVLHDEHAPARPGGRGGRRGDRGEDALEGQLHRELRALALPVARRPHAAAMELHEPLDEREAEA